MNADIPDPPEPTNAQILRLFEEEKRNRLAKHICEVYDKTLFYLVSLKSGHFSSEELTQIGTLRRINANTKSRKALRNYQGYRRAKCVSQIHNEILAPNSISYFTA